MAETSRIESLSVLLNGADTKMLLEEAYMGVLENFQKDAVSVRLKNRRLSGSPEAGTLIAKRIAKTKIQEYGTARGKGAGNKVKGIEVPVIIDRDREFVEEIEAKDISLIGIDGFIAQIAADHQIELAAELDRDFFAVAKNEGSQFKAPSSVTKINEIVEKAIVALENTKNDYIDGLSRRNMTIVFDVSTYSDMRMYLDTLGKSNVDNTTEEFKSYHGVTCVSSNRLPEGVNFIIMINEAIAQPLLMKPYTIGVAPMSEANVIMMFPHWGTKAVMPDCIMWCNTSQTA